MFKTKLYKKILMFSLVLMVAISLSSCKKKNKDDNDGDGDNENNTKKISNETTPLVFSSADLEGVFSPFYGTSGADNSITGMTQIGMLTADPSGAVAYGDNYDVVTKDMAYKFYDINNKEVASGDTDGTTKYQFVIKKDIKFSDGELLTMHDVLFNLYVYLDPVYTGSSTMYSTDIRGLAAYRLQDETASEDSNESFEETFMEQAKARMQELTEYVTNESYQKEIAGTDKEKEIKEDIDRLKVYFQKELETDYASFADGIEDYKKDHAIENVWEIFLLNEGLISYKIDAKTGKKAKNADGKYIVDTSGIVAEDVKDKQSTIKLVFDYYMGSSYTNERIAKVVNGFNSGRLLQSELVSLQKSAFYDEIKQEGNLVVENVSGIEVLTGSEFFGDNTYDDTYEILQITINGVDPKAIWNFGFTVAPMHYYSDAAHTQAAMNDTKYEKNFGVEFGDADWYRDVVKAKNSIPMGAGAYKMSTQDGSTDDLNKLKVGFYKDFMVYFERNDNFLMGKPKIKYIRFKVVNANNIMTALTSGAIDYGDPSATQYNINQVNSSEFLSQTMVRTNGYGYIGINPKYVPDINIRRAIMCAMDINLVKDYYTGDLAQLIYRPMTLCSWVYDNDDGSKWIPEAYYKAGLDNVIYYVEQAGYTKDANGKYYINTATGKEYLEYTFTIAGDTTDHPAYRTFEAAAKLLNENGWDVKVKTDTTALTKLSTGSLAVWAAAWGSTIDPDMYQIYHLESNASSTKNWGKDEILNDTEKYALEYEIAVKLSKLIDEARETLDQNIRTKLYRQALDLVMEMAVELPTYQRNDMYVYNNEIIDTSTLVPTSECTPYYSPIARIWEVSLRETK